MNIKRYLIYGGVSVAVHSVLIYASPVQKELIISTVGNESSLQIQLVSLPVSLPKPRPETEQKPETEREKRENNLQRKPAVSPDRASTPSKPERLVKATPETAESEKKRRNPEPQETVTNLSVTKISDANRPDSETAESKDTHSAQNSTEKEPEKVAEIPVPEKPLTLVEQTEHQVDSVAKETRPKLVDKPQFRAKPTPIRYPRLAKKRGQEGKVLIEVWINKQGSQTKRLILDSSGFSMLDKAALKAVSDWKFDVSVQEGQTIAHRVQIPVHFKLD